MADSTDANSLMRCHTLTPHPSRSITTSHCLNLRRFKITTRDYMKPTHIPIGHRFSLFGTELEVVAIIRRGIVCNVVVPEHGPVTHLCVGCQTKLTRGERKQFTDKCAKCASTI